MKQRISVRFDAAILRLAKQKGCPEEDAARLVSSSKRRSRNYLRQFAATPKERKTAYQLFCERPMKISRRQLRYMVKEDISGLYRTSMLSLYGK